ncbi:hypothetical protein OS493_032909 [Desmophyllum pertusum]|uniref:Uncharacterized protein n=1 Tax=Desmophyllum pertusum TaxID=174260 RepID=A0A9X0CIC8_9CNID|nr:hypothetical protein OS493_032909 [Desmophyllum pertusum]
MNEPEEKSEAPPTKQPGTEKHGKSFSILWKSKLRQTNQQRSCLASALKALDNALQTISEASETKKLTETVETNVMAEEATSEGSIGVEDLNVAVTRPIITFSDSSIPALDVTETVESNVTADMTSSEGSIGVEDLNVAVIRPIITFSDSSVPALDVTETVESNVTADMTSSEGSIGVEDLNVAVTRPILPLVILPYRPLM